jgi:two-component system chemotaxis response regulator CheY
MSQKKVLIVDDDPVVRKTLSMRLNLEGFAVTLAEDGAAAMSALRADPPDLVLLDVAFPPDVAHGGGVWRDGLTLLAWLRRMDEAKSIPVIMISGNDSPEQIKRARAAGAAGYFPKPINHDMLAVVIRQLLGLPATQPQAA